MAKLTLKKIRATKPGPNQETRLWDDDPRGFGLRLRDGRASHFFVQYRSPVTGKKVRHIIGQYGKVTLDEARAEAKRIVGALTENRDLGLERRRERLEARSNARTISELADDYMQDAWNGEVTYR